MDKTNTIRVSRRRALAGGAALLALPTVAAAGRTRADDAVYDAFPAQDAESVREVVGKSHFNLDRVTELVTARPALAKAAIDWGFGDWESALGAASHTGRREIAALLISNGARPNLFTHAMLGNLAVVKATIESSPGIEHQPGPHSIPLIDHARAGRERAEAVYEYLKSLPGIEAPSDELAEDTLAAYTGSFSFGPGASDRLETSIRKGRLSMERTGGVARFLTPVGPHAFHPAGAEAVRIVFEMTDGVASSVTVHDPMPIVVAVRIAG